MARLDMDVAWHAMPKSKLGVTGSAHNEPLFHPEESDDAWLAEVGRRGWIVFSHDRKFHTVGFESELSAIKQHGVGCFYLWGGSAKKYEKAQCFFKAYDRILAAIESTPLPFIFDVQRSGRLKRVEIP
ncbi:hypothetical protein EZ313_15905 [Ramlibacter henchirensis]|uniref:VapC45 PIN like domain-containing protein n=1 Tax=Ramlibacter henchirensis TaxID=204072 RepID=A0A4Z0BWK0_9BURK|nr:hypothetical protein EZ313_15905 [Ramlibacter henchirensis]